jgi:nitroreductase
MESLLKIISLQSIRSFKSKKIDENILQKILEAGRHAPSVHNIQPWHFIVVLDNEIKNELSKGQARFIEEAAFIVVGCGDPYESPRWHEIEVAIAMQNMVLAAWIQGIGSCWVDLGNEENIRRILEIPDKLKIVSLVAFGYPDKIQKPTWKKPISDIVHYNKF